MTRYFGILHAFCIEGEAVHHSYDVYRRRRSQLSAYRRLACGGDPCGCETPDICWGSADPYCTVDVEIGPSKSYRMGRTQTIDNNHNPKWNKEFTQLIDVSDTGGPFPQDAIKSGPNLIIRVVDDDVGGEASHDVLGQCTFPLKEISTRGKPLRVSLSLRHPRAHPKSSSISRVKLEFRWYNLDTAAEASWAVPHSYFRRSHGNALHLYHDADLCPNDDDYDPNAKLHSQPGGTFQKRSTWNDIADAIEQAQYFAFFAGWSINPAISLRRDHHSCETQHETIGELLKRRADEGIKVVVLIWDDITSREGVSWLKDGIMATYDEYTREFFRHTKVEVAVVKRIAGDDCGEVSDLLKWTSFTHHQKIVLFDSVNPFDPDGRRIVSAFVGGLDLTSGRYDTPDHSLFTTINTAHRGDFYNGCLVEATCDHGPREPWHDIHARIDGPAAWDVLQSFIERVARQAPKLTGSTSQYLNELRERRKLRDGRKVLVDPNSPRSWDIQVFRSLDTEAALFQNRKWLAKFANPNFFVDKGIQAAYMCLIDRAKRFIYIENQYFLGSSQFWLEHDDVPCHNWVPFELTRRICRAIEERETFAVHVLIPLFPEGAPGTVSVQEILHWEYQTMRMMYHRIGQKLQEVNSTRHPTEYLNFYFVAKREPQSVVVAPPNVSVEVYNAIKMRRHPIYVHSKMMIIDDEYIVIGSANINERSMAGCRDTEIAFGACQPAFQAKYDGSGGVHLPRGDVAIFRRELWKEHTSLYDPVFDDPASKECVEALWQITSKNWQAYVSDDPKVQLPHGHLCPYPIEVRSDGETAAHPASPNVPGWSASMIGVRSALLPAVLTT